MPIPQIIFIVLSLTIIGSALFVVITRNLFHAALMLMLTFFGVAGYYVLLEIGFFAVAQVLVYIGAISILFIFAVMLTRGMMGMPRNNGQAEGAAFLCIGMFIAMAAILSPAMHSGSAVVSLSRAISAAFLGRSPRNRLCRIQ